eukprot:TRINITY_DN3460_c0_g1_i1.p1 TRINITY_DN3460_c0_g1~~TRINITY_DN3460_c0_g1_i1.p1  ORF type:complete len:558 (+),score=84.56 TRINITY_DN3460_c0_g1_i1:37-1674(+)
MAFAAPAFAADDQPRIATTPKSWPVLTCLRASRQGSDSTRNFIALWKSVDRRPASAHLGRWVVSISVCSRAFSVRTHVKNCRRSRRDIFRRAQEHDGDAPLLDGGLAAWRDSDLGKLDEMPGIFFPVQDLLLVGHTKQMHLFEPRWVEMIDTARRTCGGIFALIYIVDSGDRNSILHMATVVEVITCNNLESAGRVVKVRGVARAAIKGVKGAKDNDPDTWVIVRAKEVPEFCAQDMPDADAARKQLELTLETLGSKQADVTRNAADKGSQEDPEPPRLWTHERESIEESFGTRWDDCSAKVQRTLHGVPLWVGDGTAQSHLPDLLPAVALLYAALSSADISVRLEVFCAHDESLTARLTDLAGRLEDKQRMARARRAIESAFEPAEDGDNTQREAPMDSGSDSGVRDPKLGFLGCYEQPGRYAFRVGDIVVHRGHGQFGVVAERFHVCQLDEDWVKANFPPGMTVWQPFYSILVGTAGQSFTRHGAQSSHRRWDTSRDGEAQPVQHPDVERLFSGLDIASARYQPRDQAAADQKLLANEWDKDK